MKTLKFAVASILFAMSSVVAAQEWISAGPFTNPAANTVLAERVATEYFWMAPNFICAGTAATVVVLEWRDAANVTTVRQQYVPVPANDFRQVEVPVQFLLAPGERMRLRLVSAVTGAVQCSFII